MKTPFYPQETREQIVAAYDAGTPVKEITEAFGVHFNTVYRFLKARRLTGSVARIPPRKGGTRPTLDPGQQAVLDRLYQENPDALYTEMIELLFQETGVRVTTTTMYRNLNKLGYHRVRRPVIPAKNEVSAKKRAYTPKMKEPTKPDEKFPVSLPRRAYPSDLSDAEWAQIEKYFPKPQKLGAPCKHTRREILNGILYVLRTGCQWRALPHDLPPGKTVFHYFRIWSKSKLWEEINKELRERYRKSIGRCPQASLGIIDSQSVKTGEKGGCVGTMATRKSKAVSAISS